MEYEYISDMLEDLYLRKTEIKNELELYQEDMKYDLFDDDYVNYLMEELIELELNIYNLEKIQTNVNIKNFKSLIFKYLLPVTIISVFTFMIYKIISRFI